MLRFLGSPVRHCDGLSRREFLRVGASLCGSLTLAQLLAHEAVAGNSSSKRSVVFVHLDGGAPQQDLFDLKPQAPSEIRGEFTPISTAVPGLQICELLPQLAQSANQLTILRSLVGSVGQHNAFQCQSGFDEKELAGFGGRPALGSVLSRLEGSPTDDAPPFVDLMQGRALVRNSARPGFLGPAHMPFRPDLSRLFERPLEAGMVNELKRKGENHTLELTLNSSLTLDRLSSRVSLQQQLDRLGRDVDQSGMMAALDQFSQQAVSILTSGRFAEALDLTRETPETLRRYAISTADADNWHRTSDRPNATLKFLLARRLLEAGVRCLSLSLSDFDTHSGNFTRMRQVLPILDHGLTTFLAELSERGRLEDTLIVAWGEFGRTPKINNGAGRDHWPRVGPGLLAGGHFRHGQVIGETDRNAADVRARPVHYKDVFATIYQHLGINPHTTTLADPGGRPQHLLDQGELIRELI